MPYNKKLFNRENKPNYKQYIKTDGTVLLEYRYYKSILTAQT